MRISDWSSDVCSSELGRPPRRRERRACLRSPQPRQRGGQPIGFGRLGVMIGACFIDRFGLGALDEGGVGEPGGEAVALLRRGGKRLAPPVAPGGDADHAFALPPPPTRERACPVAQTPQAAVPPPKQTPPP